MALPQKESTPIFSDATAGTLRLIAYLALAAILMVLDHHNGWLARVRYATAAVIVPVYKLAAAPANWIADADTAFTQRHQLISDNRRLREALLLAEARLNRMHAVTRQNAELKELLETRRLLDMHAQLAQLIDVQLGPSHDRVMLNQGADEGVHVGQVVIDAHGIMGQIVEVLPHASVAMLIVDPDHAIPITFERTGVRGIARGTGHIDQLVVSNLPLSSSVKAGDKLVSSGLGGRFPAGFPVGTVTALKRAASGIFLEAMVKPAAELERSGEVLLLRSLPDPVGPPAPAAPAGPPASLAPAAAAPGAHSTHVRPLPNPSPQAGERDQHATATRVHAGNNTRPDSLPPFTGEGAQRAEGGNPRGNSTLRGPPPQAEAGDKHVPALQHSAGENNQGPRR